MQNEQSYSTGKMFAEPVDVVTHLRDGRYYVCVSLGNNYYETDPYKDKGCALSEAKGYLEGLAAKLEAEIGNLDKELARLDM